MGRACRVLCLLVATTLLSPNTTAASWLSDVTGIDVNVAEGTVHVDPPTPQEVPGRIQHAIETFPAAVAGAVRDVFNPAGAGLAVAIRHARAQAQNGATPIPDAIRSQLAGIVPDQVLNDVRWNSLDKNRIDLANLTLLHNNGIAAVTVGNIIVFDRLEDAATNWYLWSHELFHTVQYANLGIEGFAHSYIISSSEIEGAAVDFSNMVESRVRARQAGDTYRPIRYQQASQGLDPDSYFVSGLQSAVRDYAPATACLDIEDNDGQPFVRNLCDISIWVHSFVEVDRRTGRSYPGICTPIPGITCEIAPRATLPVITPRRGCVSEVQFSFFGNGRNAEPGTWEGDCGDIDPPQELGRSCCMFNGGRCGPFLNQPPYPIGSSCSCRYGNPYADGEVCPP